MWELSAHSEITRRDCLRWGLATGWAGLAGTPILAAQSEPPPAPPMPKSVAAVVTVYTHNSHADVILTKILEGWKHDGGPGPALTLASIYIDQPETSDFGRELCRKHGVPLFDSIEQAVTVGGHSIPVDGVLSIGEHGNYPHNEIGQHLYPRRRFMEEITATFEKFGRVVPVFNDKHLGPLWSDAQWMYDRARQLKVPCMAGSSLPVSRRTHDISVPLGTPLEAAVGIAFGGREAYGFHGLEFYQYYVERRQEAERGVKAVQYLEGPALWQVVDEGRISQDALHAAFAAVSKSNPAVMRQDKQAGLFLLEYVDGFTGALMYLECVGGWSIGLTLKGKPAPLATAFDDQTEPRFPHFAYLLRGIEQMIHTGRPSYPVERTLLTSGILDRALHSRAQGGVRLATPELEIAYRPVDYPHAPHVDLLSPISKGEAR
jgi:hypothetical protein